MRIGLWALALVSAIAGFAITVPQLEVVQNNEGGTLVDFPSEIMTGTFGLALLVCGLFLLGLAFRTEVALRAKLHSI
ncbi:hypothetical protein [Leucobacter luti]|uniref:hypothetical protein n=1 Tax=Leucobacter luti TaxID=340320 RepID=UPI00105BD006|nr:hypothetical protein [Leucobacter luti]